MNIVSLMSTGAAPGLALDLAMSAKARGLTFKLIITTKNELLHLIELNLKSNEYAAVSIPKNVSTLAMHYLSRGSLVRKKIEPHLNGNEPIVFTMPGILEFLWMKDKKRKSKVITVIHDPYRHRGDMMPRNFMIKFLYKQSDRIIYFSEFTRNYLKDQYTKRSSLDLVVSHPISSVISRLSNTGQHNSDYILLIGRNKSYQNFEFIVKVWKEEQHNLQNVRLLIAGKNTQKFRDEASGVYVIDKWLDEIEFANLIRSTKCLLLPYLEASQSGPASLAMAMHKPIIYSKIEGLDEQLSDYDNAESYEGKQELIQLLNKANREEAMLNEDFSDWLESWAAILSFIEGERHARH
jgi:glycosyltransferase involved in cell wall biosynthesis